MTGSIQDPDQELVQLAQNGDKKAYAELVKKYYEMVFAISYGVLSRREDAQDVAQEVFLKVFNQLKKFEGKSKFKSWLYRIATNQAIDATRKRRPAEPAEKIDLAESTQPRPGQELVTNETKNMVRVALNSLSPEHRAILVLREWHDLSYEEIAEMLELETGTVMSRLFYARKSLAKILSVTLGESANG